MADIEVATKAGTAVVTINRPSKRNALTLEMWRELTRRFGELGADTAVRAVILTGAGNNFSVGADISEFSTVREDAAQSAEYETTVDLTTEAIASTPKPVIAAVRGYCLGGGCHLATACDFRFAEPGAYFGIPAARLSIVYGVSSTQRLLALVGLTQAKRILYTAARLDADEARRIGLVEETGADALALATTFAATFEEVAPLTVAGAKFILSGLIAGSGGLDVEAAHVLIDRAAASEDYKEGRHAFAEKRSPRFTGR